MIDPQPHPHDTTVGYRVAASTSVALATMLFEYFWYIRQEIKVIWPRFRTSWYSRIYMFGRYIGLASQIFNVAFSVRMALGFETSPTGCRFWFTYQAVVVQILLICVQGLFMQRLWALFLRSRLILVILIMFACCQAASMVVSAKLSFPSNKYTVTCMMMKGNPGNAFFSATTLTVNVAIFFMTFWRYFRLPVKWTREGIGRILFRDSALSLSAIVVVMIFLMLCSLQVIKPTMSGNITYYWLVVILWISLGRMITNSEQLPRDQDGQEDGDTWKGTLELTSQIEMGQSTLSLETQYGSSEGPTGTGTGSRTLQSSLSTPMTKASQLSPSSGCSSDRRWFGDLPPSDGDTLQTSSTEVSAESAEPSTRPPSPSTPCSDGDPQQTEDRSQADEDVPRPAPSPRPSSSEPSSEQCS